MKRLTLIALFLATFALAEGVPDGKSLYWGGRMSWILGSAWNDEPVRGVFSRSGNRIEESELIESGSWGLELGALCWYRLNSVVGFEGEANMKWVDMRLSHDIYNRTLDGGEYDQAKDAFLLVWSLDFPLVVRVTPTPSFYLESGAQFNLNLGTDLSSDDESFEFDAERYGWSLVFGGGAYSYTPQKNLLWSAGLRLVIDMTRIEKEGIVEIWKGAAYREASPMKLWNFQFNLAFYF